MLSGGTGRRCRTVSDTHQIAADVLPPRIRFHDLRHSAVTLLLEKNVDVKVVSEMLGHSHVGVTMDLYQHVTPTMQQGAADTSDRLLSDRPWRSVGWSIRVPNLLQLLL